MQNIIIFNLSLYNVILYFTIYAFIGWCIEVVYAAIKTGEFVNRGFLNGPVCPIYGFGVVILIELITPIGNNLILIFIVSIIVTSLIEFITGFILEKLFNNRWWDYSQRSFNIKGYICLRFSLIWGLASVFVVKIIHTVIRDITKLIPILLGNIMLGVIITLLIIDMVAAVETVLKFNVRLKKIDEISARIKESSDTLAKEISKDSIEFKRKHEDELIAIKTKYDDEVDGLKQNYNNLIARKNILHRRLIRAFPNIRSNKYFEALEELKKNATRRG
ncbi:putative ABC transporter permease [Clostridium akagii]|uniref:putative ABC transporter permease n=1 Tax=Clostridium akagii TaxID=91623 RepID=UPI00047B6194|nr:putative ABC transporter permease [Clostridium akagii]